jgi:GNAT superfamily N-acetyltransferase
MTIKINHIAMNIKTIKSAEEKIEICKSIVEQLPWWFDEQGRKDYVANVGNTKVWACFEDEKPVGFISIKSNNEFTSEIYVFGVLKEYQRNGVGSQLIGAVLNELRSNDFKLLAVKTLDESADYEPYNQTRNFYSKQGFVPVDVYKKIWNEENPCLLMIKVVNK